MAAVYLRKYFKQNLILENYTVAIYFKENQTIKVIGKVTDEAPGTREFADVSDHLFIISAFLAGTERTLSSFPFIRLLQSHFQIL